MGFTIAKMPVELKTESEARRIQFNAMLGLFKHRFFVVEIGRIIGRLSQIFFPTKNLERAY